MQDKRPGKQAAPRAAPLPPDKDLPHQGLNTLAFLLPRWERDCICPAAVPCPGGQHLWRAGAGRVWDFTPPAI